MLVPKITSSTLDPALQRALALLPAVLYTDAAQAVAASASSDAAIWADTDAAAAKELLNRGVAVAVHSGEVPADVDAARIAVRYSAAQGLEQAVERALGEGVARAGAVVLQLTRAQIEEGAQLARLVAAADARAAGESGPVRVLVELSGTWTEDLLARVGRAGASAVVEAD
ncbi:hypothetical protein IWW52_005604, partial [Coemansia sp. RSA 2704]